jgi:hypothetical protein
MKNEAFEALVSLQLMSMYSDIKMWAWVSAITACIALFIFMVSESKFWIWLSCMAAFSSIYFFWRLSSITDTLASRGIYL